MSDSTPLFGDKKRVEIERKFLVYGREWKQSDASIRVRQAFLSIEKRCTVRVRSVLDRGVITVKGPTIGFSRQEFEYEIPKEDAEHLMTSLAMGSIIEKIRYRIPLGGFVWEVDEFLGDNLGLVVAEIELESEDQEFDRPSWVGEEVSDDPRYFNAYLATHPYRDW